MGEQRGGPSVPEARTRSPCRWTRPLAACSVSREGPQQPSAVSCLETRLPGSSVSRNSSESSRRRATGTNFSCLSLLVGSSLCPCVDSSLSFQASLTLGPTRTHTHSRSLTLVLTHSLALTRCSPLCPRWALLSQLPLQGLGRAFCLHASLFSNPRSPAPPLPHCLPGGLFL